MANARILVVEDEPVIALDIEQHLLHLGYEVAAIADCAEGAFKVVAHHPPDLILMDIHLDGDIDGIMAAAKIRQSCHLPIVFLTAHADETTLEQAKTTQPFGYIVKPFEPHNLSTVIEIALSRHHAEIAIQRSLDKEKELNELKSRFISIVSHEFRNPLSSILFSLSLLERQNDQITAEKKQTYIHRAKASVDRMKQLLEEVLIISEAEASGLQYRPTPLNLFKFCYELVEELQCSAGVNHSILLTATSGVEALGERYCFDEKLLRHILTNLLSNAIKYSPKGGQVSLTLECETYTVMIQVKDQGIGILPDDQARLFDSFHRGTNVSNISGTGLGLSIVKQCVDAHGGDISVKSTVGTGTIFSVALPLKSDG